MSLPSPTSELSGVTPSPSPTSEHMESSDRDEVSPLNEADIKRSKRLSLILNTFKNLPDHVNTVILGDSNTHSVRGKDVDRKGNKVCVRSFGGLCIYHRSRLLRSTGKEFRKELGKEKLRQGRNKEGKVNQRIPCCFRSS